MRFPEVRKARFGAAFFPSEEDYGSRFPSPSLGRLNNCFSVSSLIFWPFGLLSSSEGEMLLCSLRVLLTLL